MNLICYVIKFACDVDKINKEDETRSFHPPILPIQF